MEINIKKLYQALSRVGAKKGIRPMEINKVAIYIYGNFVYFQMSFDIWEPSNTALVR